MHVYLSIAKNSNANHEMKHTGIFRLSVYQPILRPNILGEGVTFLNALPPKGIIVLT